MAYTTISYSLLTNTEAKDINLSISHFYDYESYEMTLQSNCFKRLDGRVLQYLYHNFFFTLLYVKHVLKHHKIQ